MITERLERREERDLSTPAFDHIPPQQTECTSSFLHLRPIQAKIKTFITLFEKCKRIYGLKMMKSEFKKAGTLQLTGIRRIDENFSLWETRELMERTVDICGGQCGYCGWLLLSLHILLVLPFRNFHIVTHTAVSSPKCNSEKRPLSNSVAFQTLFKWYRYCGILKIHIVRKINPGIRYEPVYRPALYGSLLYRL